MAPSLQQDLAHARGEDFTDALDDMASISGSTTDEGIEMTAHAPAVSVSSLVPPEESNVRVPPPGSSAKQLQIGSNTLPNCLLLILTRMIPVGNDAVSGRERLAL